jgi:hypothetical protein
MVVATMNRKAMERWGHGPAPDVAYCLIHADRRREMVTWAGVMAARRAEQSRRLETKRYARQWRACRLWVAYFDQNLMGGWHAFLDDWRGDSFRVWIRADHLKRSVIDLFPLVEGGLDEWWRWMPAFAEEFERRRQAGRPVGVAFVWWNGFDPPRLGPRQERNSARVAHQDRRAPARKELD